MPVVEENPKIKIDAEYDLAVVRVSGRGKPLPLDNVTPEVSEKVFTIGNPQGLANSLSDGVISGVRSGDAKVLQTTAAISPGSSGGPLIGMAGMVVGVTTFYLDGSQSLNFAVSSHKLASLMGGSEEILLSKRYPERSDAISVAAAFLYAVHKNDVETALIYVDPKDQENFESAMTSGSTPFPEIPEDAVLEISVGALRDGAPHTEVSVKGTKLGIDLIKYRDTWWVAK